ncbi:DUF5990 family protein [Gandjariella thermophila]|uniref:Uncharacterized protein n=1 Tax=Gandjariella thermophila TaxID=1931992 RepID=A0A4D4JA55_9PSEU|nr:DUF5990 family protein [Gandjariella thermophila]GDY30807.1 hypothetical protein GTS_24400 [Gandjariella thermophila]
MAELNIRIVGTNLPGARFAGHHRVHLGIQRENEVVAAIPGDAQSAVFELSIDAAPDDGGVDFSGPYVHGEPGGRFLRLCWGDLDEAGAFHSFDQVDLDLTSLGPDLVDQAAVGGVGLEATLRLSDDRGGPRSTPAREPELDWRLASAGRPGMEPGDSGWSVNR